MNTPQVSINIPLKEPNKYLDECIRHCADLNYPDFEDRSPKRVLVVFLGTINSHRRFISIRDMEDIK